MASKNGLRVGMDNFSTKGLQFASHGLLLFALLLLLSLFHVLHDAMHDGGHADDVALGYSTVHGEVQRARHHVACGVRRARQRRMLLLRLRLLFLGWHGHECELRGAAIGVDAIVVEELLHQRDIVVRVAAAAAAASAGSILLPGTPTTDQHGQQPVIAHWGQVAGHDARGTGREQINKKLISKQQDEAQNKNARMQSE
jgi:hypothetical protein